MKAKHNTSARKIIRVISPSAFRRLYGKESREKKQFKALRRKRPERDE